MLDIVVFALFRGRGNPRYKRVLASFYTCCLELFLVARDKRHSTARRTALTVQASARDPLSGSQKYRSIIMMSFRRHEVTRTPVLQRTTSTIMTRMPPFAFAHYGMTLLSVIPQTRSDKDSSATRTTSTIKTWIPPFASAHYGMTLLSVIPQTRSGKESGATTHNFHNHDLDAFNRIRSLRNDTTKFGRCA